MALLLGNNTRVGVSASYVHQDVELAFDGRAKSAAPVVTVFSGHGMPDGTGPQVFGALAYGHLETTIDRGYVNGAATTTSHGETIIDGFGGYGRVGWGLSLGSELVVTPFGDLSNTWSKQQAYTETTGPFPASFEERTHASLVARLGLDVDLALSAEFHILASAAWGHRLVDDADPVNGEIIGLFEATAGVMPRGADWAEASVGAETEIGYGFTTHAEIGAKIGASGDAAYSAEAGFRQAL
jgi:outer membrane autotransporter protein